MVRKLLIFGGLAAALLALVLWSKFQRGNDAETVQSASAERKLIRSSILASGTLAYREQVQLRSEVIAKVIDVHVAEADPVQKGDLLISLDPENFEAQLQQADAGVRLQEIAIDRQQLRVQNLARRTRNQRELLRNNLVDENTVENLVNELAVAKVDLVSLEESLAQARAARAQAADLLSKTQIVSPIDGIVIQVDVKVGETVIAGTTNIPGSTIMVVADTSEMLVEVRVDEADVAQVGAGQRADIFAAAFPDDALGGAVESIGTTARQTAGQQSLWFLVKILLDDPEAFAVRSGMSARADIYTQSAEETLAVPIQAVRYDEENRTDSGTDQAYVLRLEDGKAVRQNVSLGLSSDSDQEITEGLSEGDRVITGPFRVLRQLRDGDAVQESDSKDESVSDDEAA